VRLASARPQQYSKPSSFLRSGNPPLFEGDFAWAGERATARQQPW
jgi:hypothetical protein